MDGLLDRDTGINRYIMECKYKSNGEAKDFNDELIDTLWNVNIRM